MHETSLMLDRLVVIKIDGSLWGGRKKLRREDLILADGSVLPPESLASLGSKRIADPQELLVFTRLKREAERICLQVGSRFLGGIAIPEAELPAIRNELERIASEFEIARKDYLERYDDTLEEWVARHPDFAQAIRRAVEPVDVVARQLNFDYVIFRVKPPEDEGDLLGQRVGSLSSQLFEEIALMARRLAQDSLIGKDRVSRKALNPLRRMCKKLDGLAFLDHRVTPVVETITDLIKRAPHTGELSGSFLREVLATTLLLSDPDSIRKHGEGLLDPVDTPCDAETDDADADADADDEFDDNLFSVADEASEIDEPDAERVEIPEDSESEPESDFLFDPAPVRNIPPITGRDCWF